MNYNITVQELVSALNNDLKKLKGNSKERRFLNDVISKIRSKELEILYDRMIKERENR